VKTSRLHLGCLLLLTVSACGGGSNPSSLVVVTVSAAPDMLPVAQLRVTVTHLSDASVARSDTELFPVTASPTPIEFDASFALAFPKSLTGSLAVEVDALGNDTGLVATGSGEVAIVVGGRANITIHLANTGAKDAGVDSAATEVGPVGPDSAPLDGEATADATGLDGPGGSDALEGDGTGETDAPSADGAGGAGGNPGTGGGNASSGGSGGGGAGGASLDGATSSDASRDVNNNGGGGGISSTGGTVGQDGGTDASGLGGAGGSTSTGGSGGTGGTTIADASDTGDATSADAVDVPSGACSSSVSCPTYPNCRIQPVCDTGTGTCSAPSQCSVCGNGLVEFSEECDDGNTTNGDHCNSTCKWEYCGDGILQSQPLAALSLIYLARSCNVSVEQDIWLVLNGHEVARGMVAQTCDCQPGIVTLPVTNPAFLQLGNNGTNVVEVHTYAEISWAVVRYESPSGPGERYPIDTGGNGAAQYRRPDLCVNGTVMGMESGVQMTLAGGEQCDHGLLNGTAGDSCNANCTVN